MIVPYSLYAQQQESYTFCTGGSYAYLLDTAASTTSSYYARWTIGSTGYSAKFQKDTIYQSSSAKEAGGYSSVKKWACTSTSAASLVWTYTASNMHHDICPLPNGNVLVIVQDSKTSSQIQSAGGSYSSSAAFEKIQEIHPVTSTTGTVVWEWKLFDHVCQSTNSSVTSTYVSSVAANPQLFNLALVTSQDFFHLNGIDYNPTLDQIVFSSHMLNEVFIIDHSTTTAQAATHTGGNAGKGGDFLYRWGRPQNYGCTSNGNGITLNVIHDVRWIASTNTDYPNYISMFHNGGCSSGKGAVLFLPPHNGYNYTYTPGSVIGPTTCTTPTTPSFSVANQGGCNVLENGNILITNPGSKFYECSGTGTNYQQVSVGTIQSDRLKKCEVIGPFPNVSASATTVCANTPFTLSSSATSPLQTTPSYSYSWSSTPSGFSSALQNPTVTPTTAGTYTYVVTVTSGGCSNTASVTVNVNALPTANAGADVEISQGSSTTLTATGGGTYSWSNGASGASTIVTPSVTTTYVVTVTGTNGCTASDNVVVSVITNPLSVTVSATPDAVCSGTSVQLNVSPNGGTSYTYLWSSSPAGFSSTLQNPTVSPTITTTYTVAVSSSGYTATSSVIVTVNALPTANAGTDVSICNGGSTSLTASGGTGYHWSSGEGTATISAGPATTTTYIVTVTDANACQATDAVTVAVNATVPASATITANPAGSICEGTSVTFTATPVNGGTSPVYQWRKNGNSISGATNATYTSTTLINNDIITCGMTSNAGCVTGSPATSNAIAMIVNSGVAASVSIAASPAGAVCTGTSVTFTASALNGGTSPAYQWMKNGSAISGASSSSYTSSSLVNNDIISCEMISNASCVTSSPASSNAIAMSVNSDLPASISIAASPGTSICTGSSVTFTATPTNGGSTPSYQWNVNGSAVSGANSPTYTTASLLNNDVVTCVMTSALGCVTGSPASSNDVTISVSSSLVPAVTISASATTICSGTTVVFTPSPTNGGTPAYQWLLNGSNAGSGSTFSSSSLADGDMVSCIMTSGESCASPATAPSNTITLTVGSSVAPSVSISADPGTEVCPGTLILFSALPVHGGIPSYQWTVDGVNAGTSSTLSGIFNNGQVIGCSMNSTETCVNPVLANAAPVTVSHYSLQPVTISQNLNTLESSAISGNQWYEQSSGLIAGATGQTYSPAANGNYYTAVTDGNGCIVSSNVINFTMVGIDPAQNATFQLYPNPTNGIFSIEISNAGDAVWTVEISDMAGRIIFNKKMNLMIPENRVIDIRGFSNGVYFVSVYNHAVMLKTKILKK